jgi:hypothetical protein
MLLDVKEEGGVVFRGLLFITLIVMAVLYGYYLAAAHTVREERELKKRIMNSRLAGGMSNAHAPTDGFSSKDDREADETGINKNEADENTTTR